MTPTRRATPPLSVIVATSQPWPALEGSLGALVPQADECGAEIVVVDGNGAALPPEVPGCVAVVAAPGQDVFALRAIGLAAARGEIVAMIEDHCIAHDDFCRAVLRAHRDSPRAAISGTVTNGTPHAAIDRANFLAVHGDSLLAPSTIPRSWIPGPANTSYKRAALPSTKPAVGWLETVLNPTLVQQGEAVFDARIVVSHVQSTGRVGTFVNHFHAGRSMAGLARRFVPRGHRRRVFTRGAVSLGPSLVRRAWRVGRSRPEQRAEVYRLLPLVAGLALADVIGFTTGALAGPGHSASRVR